MTTSFSAAKRPVAQPVDDRKRRIAVVAPVAVLVVMYPVFHLAGVAFGDAVEGYLGWAVGLAIYWLVWGFVFPLWMLGWDGIRQVVRPRKPDGLVLLLVAVPLAMSIIGRLFVPDVAYEPATTTVLLLLIGTSLGNGVFEEVLWRGVYLRLFSTERFLGVVWPSVWFGLWHLAPAAALADGGAVSLVISSIAFGFLLAYVARRTESVGWPIVTHTCAGLILMF